MLEPGKMYTSAHLFRCCCMKITIQTRTNRVCWHKTKSNHFQRVDATQKSLVQRRHKSKKRLLHFANESWTVSSCVSTRFPSTHSRQCVNRSVLSGARNNELIKQHFVYVFLLAFSLPFLLSQCARQWKKKDETKIQSTEIVYTTKVHTTEKSPMNNSFTTLVYVIFQHIHFTSMRFETENENEKENKNFNNTQDTVNVEPTNSFAVCISLEF